ncbi:MAG: hypothetical protein ACTSRI_02040 [Promethearchaeota archaeon]
MNLQAIIDKCKREYQGEHRLLVIVLRSDVEIDLTDPKYGIHFPSNVKLMNYKDFADAIGLEGKYKTDFLTAWEMAIEAIPYTANAESAYNDLEDKADDADKKLKLQFPSQRTHPTNSLQFNKFLNLLKFLPTARQKYKRLDDFY